MFLAINSPDRLRYAREIKAEPEAKMTKNGRIWSNIRIIAFLREMAATTVNGTNSVRKGRVAVHVMTRLHKGLQDLIQDKHYILLAQYGRTLTRTLKLQ